MNREEQREREQLERWFEEVEIDEDNAGDDSDEEDSVHESKHDTRSDISEDSGKDSETKNIQEYDFYSSRHKKDKLKWSKYPSRTSVRTSAKNIVIAQPGAKGYAKQAKTPLECFSLFFDDEILDKLVFYTNIYICQVKSNFQRERDAKETNKEEICALLGLLIMSGVLRSSHLNFKDLWSTDGTGVEIFLLTMSYNRFLFLLRCVRFDDIASRQERKNIDNLAPIREFCDILSHRFVSNYEVGISSTIDEQLVEFRGRFKGRVYLPNKPNKYGLKIFSLVDAQTFYLTSFEVYCGRQPEGPYNLSNEPDDIVKRLVKPIKGSGRNLTTDNWYTSVELATDLLKPEYNFTLVGTLQKNEPAIPKEFLPQRSRPVLSSLFGFRQGMTMVSYVPKANKSVILLSTMHFDDAIDVESKELQKPEIITFYNSTKGGVDTVDKLCATYNVGRRTKRWPLALFYHFINVGAINALIIHKSNTEMSETHTRRFFLKKLATALVKDYQIAKTSYSAVPLQTKKRLRVMTGVFETTSTSQATRGRCYLCPRKDDKKHQNKCKSCQTFVCKSHASIVCSECFEESH